MFTIAYDHDLVEELAASFALRPHNLEALDALARQLDTGADPGAQYLMHMATGSGKTFLMAAFIEYLRRNGKRNVLVVTPGHVIQNKTIANFTPGHRKFIPGAAVAPVVTTPLQLMNWNQDSLHAGVAPTKLLIANIDQLTGLKDSDGKVRDKNSEAHARWGLYKDNELVGNVVRDLQELDDLVIIADEVHRYSESAVARSSSLRAIGAAMFVGLTATLGNFSDEDVIFRYPLYRAMLDGHVKRPVLALRSGGYNGDDAEEQQLRDAKTLLDNKAEQYRLYAEANGLELVHPLLLVASSDISHATEIENLLTSPEYFGSADAVLRYDSGTKNTVMADLLNSVDRPDSPVRAVINVNMLGEGWDVRNVAVICALRAAESEVLTHQIMGRGLRLPFGKITNNKDVDQLDILSHRSFRSALKEADILETFGLDANDRAPKSEDNEPPAGGASVGGAQTPGETETGTGTSQDKPDPGAAGTGSTDAGRDGDGHTKPGPSTNDTVEVKEIPDDGVKRRDPVVETVRMNPEFEGLTFSFPQSTMRYDTSVQFTLDMIEDARILETAQVIVENPQHIKRSEIEVDAARRRLHLKTAHDAVVDSATLDRSEVIEHLVSMVQNMRSLSGHVTSDTDYLRNFIVVPFVDAVTPAWTEKVLAQARGELNHLLSSEVTAFEKARPTPVTVTPLELPIDSEFTLDPDVTSVPASSVESRADFVKHRPYNGYSQSLFPVVSFDAYSSEFRIASMLEASAEVTWWKRLEQSDDARIAITPTRNYFPDFVAYEQSTDTYWIIEGKRADGREDATVQEKAKTTQLLVQQLRREPVFKSQRWRYVIAYENTIDTVDTWSGLKNWAQTQGW